MIRKGLDAMAFFAQLLVLIEIFLLASYANAFLNLNQVAGNQILLNHLIQFKETNKQNSSQMEINKTQTNNSWQY
jgi:hypothetical protein